jgi:hypothetical protein
VEIDVHAIDAGQVEECRPHSPGPLDRSTQTGQVDDDDLVLWS